MPKLNLELFSDAFKSGATQHNNIKNPVKLLGDGTAIVYCNGHGKIHECIVDVETIEKYGNNACWTACKSSTMPDYYIRFYRNYKSYNLHKLILPCEKDKMIDHINRNTLDNRRCNLRAVTPAENMLNKKQYKNCNCETNIRQENDSYYVTHTRKFNDLDVAKQASEEIRQILNKYAELDRR